MLTAKVNFETLWEADRLKWGLKGQMLAISTVSLQLKELGCAPGIWRHAFCADNMLESWNRAPYSYFSRCVCYSHEYTFMQQCLRSGTDHHKSAIESYIFVLTKPVPQESGVLMPTLLFCLPPPPLYKQLLAGFYDSLLDGRIYKPYPKRAIP